ncbi:MAG TPA: DUF4258 domain-containing protein [Desulfobacteraceae bacterium]|nr:DUF4258 domain-containing protein [Desulfobacteraceae bacterium]HPJ66736.1 DUF4258 domain-containing protein [Desulfobacteraceae bacterium]
MHLTKHAIFRSQQRGIPKDYIEMIMEYGTPTRKPGNAIEYKINKRHKNEIIRYYKNKIDLVEKCAKKAILLDASQNTVITVYNWLS